MEQYRTNKMVIFLFLLPALAIYIVLAVVPIMQSLYFGFFDWSGIQGIPLEFVGLKNFVRMFESKEFLLSLKNVIHYMLLTLAIQIPLSYGLAILLSKCYRGFKLFKVFFFFPVVLPLTATSLLWVFIFFPNETGVLNMVLSWLGLDSLTTAWLLNPYTALNSIVITNVWAGFGYHMMIGFASLSSIPEEILESAELDGAKGFKKLWYILLPIIWESVKISVVLIVTGNMKQFDMVFVMTGGGPNGLTQLPATLMYFEAFRYDHYGLGSAISVFLFIVCIALAIFSLKAMEREKIEY